jgi:hypothetical protein
MAVTLEQATEIKARHERDWLKRSGVNAVDVGKSGEDVVIRVYVDDPAKVAGLPSQIEGVPVQVIRRKYELH